MASKSYKKKRVVKNKSRKHQRGGNESGATGYVSKHYGDLSAQMNNADPHNLIQQIPVAPAQSGGKKSKTKSMKLRKNGKKQRGGHPSTAPYSPAELSEPYPGQNLEQTTGQKGGGLLERALVPFGLIGLQRLMGKRVKSHKKK
jgi:hypothetical protein